MLLLVRFRILQTTRTQSNTVLPLPRMRDRFLVFHLFRFPASTFGADPFLRWTCSRQDQSLKLVSTFWALQHQNRHLPPPGVSGIQLIAPLRRKNQWKRERDQL